jgi:hypothetical protein
MVEMIQERGPLIGSVLGIALIVTAILCFSTNSNAMFKADLEMEFTTEEQYAEVTGSGVTEVQYEGFVKANAVSLPPGQIMTVQFKLVNEELEHEFDPLFIMMTNDDLGEEFSFVLTIFVDRNVQAGETLIEAYAFYSYDPGVLGGTSNRTKASLLVQEYRKGEISIPDSIDINEGSMGLLDVEVENTGNTWIEYDLMIEGMARAESKGILVETEKVHTIELFYQAGEVLNIDIYVEDIRTDTSISLTFILKDHETGEEYSTEVFMINAIDTTAPIIPDDQTGGDEPDPDDDGDTIPSGPIDPEPPEGSISSSSPSSEKAWIIIPAAVILSIVGIGSYLFIANRKNRSYGSS